MIFEVERSAGKFLPFLLTLWRGRDRQSAPTSTSVQMYVWILELIDRVASLELQVPKELRPALDSGKRRENYSKEAIKWASIATDCSLRKRAFRWVGEIFADPKKDGGGSVGVWLARLGVVLELYRGGVLHTCPKGLDWRTNSYAAGECEKSRDLYEY